MPLTVNIELFAIPTSKGDGCGTNELVYDADETLEDKDKPEQ